VIAGLVAMLIANAATIAGAHALLGVAGTRRPATDLVLLLVLRLLLVSLAVEVAGLLGILHTAGVGAVAIAGLGVLWALGLRDWRPRFPLPDAGRLLAVAVAIVAARLAWQVWFFVPYTADALSYHLPKVAEWVRAAAFTREMGLDSHATFPAGFELLEAWWVVFLRHDVVIEMAGVEMLLLAAAATHALARHVGLPSRWACLAAFVAAMTPGLQLGATSCLNDVAVAALVLATAALVVAGAPLGLLALVVGLGLGVKPTYGYALPGLVVLWMLEQRAEPSGRPALGAMAALGAMPALVLGVLGLLAGGFWYARNWLWFGSPVHPMGPGGILNGVGGPVLVQYGPSWSGLLTNLRDLLEHRILDPHAYSGLSRDVAGFGAAAFACGTIALPLALRDADSRFRRLTLGFLASLASVLLLALHDHWYARFVLFFPALLAIAVAWVARGNRWVLLPTTAALALAFLGTLKPDEISPTALRSLVDAGWRERTLAASHRVVWEGDAIGYYADFGEAYWLYRPDYSSRVVYLRAVEAETLAQEMRAAGLRELYTLTGSSRQRQVIADAERRGILRRRPPQTFYELN
jgi:hypothetical protein